MEVNTSSFTTKVSADTLKNPTFVFPPVPPKEWRRPPLGMSKDEFARLHSMDDMAERGHEEWKHTQVITHRYSFYPGMGYPENGISTLEASAERGHQNHEVDMTVTSDQEKIIDHDFSPARNIGIFSRYEDLSAADVVGKNLLIRHFKRRGFAPESTRTDDTVQTTEEQLRQGREIVPKGTFLVDCRNNDIGVFAAWISHRPERTFSLLMFYTFTISSAKQLVAEIEKYDPHSDWRNRAKLVLNLYPSELVTLATRYGMPADSVEDFVQVGKKLLTGLSEEGIPLFSLLAMCSGIDPKDVEDMHDEEVRLAVYAEVAIVEIVNWARGYSGFKNLKIGTGTRAYDVSIPQEDGSREYFTYDLYTGYPVPWSHKHGLRMIRQFYATPGRAEKVLKPDLVCTDAPESVHFHCCGVEADTSNGFRHPRFDTVPEVK